MATKISKLTDEERLLCIGAGNADASDGILYRNAEDNRAALSGEQRVLIIGLGGQGIKSVNKIKNEVQSKFQDTEGKIAFAALDTDALDLKNYTALSDSEKFVIPSGTGINARYNQKLQRSDFTKSWINPDFNVNLTMDGANQVREACRAKLFDESSVTYHTDARIIDFLKKRTTSVLNGFDPNTMKYRVHIITGIAGGTGSGGLVEIAHFVHRAFDNYGDKLQVYGYLYLPDVVEQYHVGKVSMPKIRANGYAALKELDYYYSVFQREGIDYMYLSTYGEAPYEVTRHKKLYNMVYLVSGSNGGGVVNKNKNAIDTVSASVINQLSDTQNAKGAGAGDNQFLTESFLANQETARKGKLGTIYTETTQEEKPNESGEDSFGYSAIGVATAAIPEQTIKMYAVSKLVKTVSGKKDGFEPATAFQGFRQDALTPAEVKPYIEKMLALTPRKVETKIRALCDNAMQWPENPELKRDEILGHTKDNDLRSDLGKSRAQGKVTQQITAWFDSEYVAVREAITAFLKTEGPKAFVDMFDGYDPVGKHYEDSLSAAIREYRAAKNNDINTKKTGDILREAEERIATPAGKLFFKDRGAAWTGAFRANEIEDLAMKIATDHVFGESGVYRSHYLDKIVALAEEIKVFDYTLKQLFGAYESMGTKFETVDDFVEAANEENATNVNIIAAESDYNWAKSIVDRRAANIAFTTVRDKIVDSFMADPKQWTEYDSARPDKTPRRVMDEIVADQVRDDDELSVITLIQHKLDNGVSMEKVVRDLVSDLKVKATPLYNVKPKYLSGVSGNFFTYLIVPQDLIYQGETGAALKKCFEDIGAEMGATPYFSANAESIVCYSLYCALPAYALADLETWEAAYENPANRTFIHSNESDTGIYNPETGLRWVDYPSLCLKQDPRLPDSQGKVSREGEFFKNVIDPMFADALSKGVITEDTVDAGGTKKYSYSCYLMDNPGWDYSINFDDYSIGEDGLYPTDDRLYMYFARNNHGSLEDVKKPIRLLEQGNFNEPYPNRKIAMDRAKRALRRNVPLFLALKKTLSKYDDVTKAIREANAVVLQEQVGTLVPYYIASGLLSQPTKNRWMLSDYPVFGKQTEIVRMDPFAMNGNKLYAKGCKYLVLWKAFMDKVSSDPQIQTMWQQAFADMTNDPDSYVDDFMNRLRPFKEEADDFVAKYDGSIPSNTGARQALRRDLNMDSEALDELVVRYLRIIEVYNQIADYK